MHKQGFGGVKKFNSIILASCFITILDYEETPSFTIRNKSCLGEINLINCINTINIKIYIIIATKCVFGEEESDTCEGARLGIV